MFYGPPPPVYDFVFSIFFVFQLQVNILQVISSSVSPCRLVYGKWMMPPWICNVFWKFSTPLLVLTFGSQMRWMLLKIKAVIGLAWNSVVWMLLFIKLGFTFHFSPFFWLPLTAKNVDHLTTVLGNPLNQNAQFPSQQAIRSPRNAANFN